MSRGSNNDIDDLYTADPAVLDEHWLWGSVRRVRRGITKILSPKPAVVKPKQKVHRRQTNVFGMDDEEEDKEDEKDGSGDDDYPDVIPHPTNRNELDKFNETSKFR